MMSLGEINRLASVHKIGERGTPVVSFWPMREKWLAFGDYWEQWGFDGDPKPAVRIVEKPFIEDDEIHWESVEVHTQQMPAILKLIYFVIPETQMVCQVCYVHEPASYDADFYEKREKLVTENLKWALEKRSISA